MHEYPKVFIKYSNNLQDVYENKALIIFDDMIADMISNKKLNQ